MKINPTYLLAVCFTILGLSGVVAAQDLHGNSIKRHAVSRSHRKLRRQRLVSLTLKPVHGKGVYHLQVSPAVAKQIAKSKDKTVRVVP
jgi:hypothetical protein